jgi:hypothetical protein
MLLGATLPGRRLCGDGPNSYRAVTQTRKILTAAALLAAGFGVASLLGSPRAPYLPQVNFTDARARNAQVGADWRASADASQARKNSGARLVPDVPDGASSEPVSAVPLGIPTRETGDAIGPPIVSAGVMTDKIVRPTETAAVPASIISPEYRQHNSLPVDPKEFATRQAAANSLPRATLLNARSALRADDGWPGDAKNVTIGSTTVLTAGDVAVARFDPPQLSERPAVSRASNDEPAAEPPLAAAIAPPTMTAAPELRTHIVIDGDSLPKLAGRYLDDPRRSNEIFELNRGVLENVELLPIGAELKLPARALSHPAQAAGAPLDTSLAAAVHTAMDGLVPVRPVPPASSIMPRAKLLEPLSAGGRHDAGR